MRLYVVQHIAGRFLSPATACLHINSRPKYMLAIGSSTGVLEHRFDVGHDLLPTRLRVDRNLYPLLEIDQLWTEPDRRSSGTGFQRNSVVTVARPDSRWPRTFRWPRQRRNHRGRGKALNFDKPEEVVPWSHGDRFERFGKKVPSKIYMPQWASFLLGR